MSATIKHLQDLSSSLKKEKEELIRLLKPLEEQLAEANRNLQRREREIVNLKKAAEDQEQQYADLKDVTRSASMKLKQHEFEMAAVKRTSRTYALSLAAAVTANIVLLVLLVI
ncbi:MAG: hypothetical protein QF926_15085 [Alphaproteobacteria bacterium]|jgi:predicted  nucleic acid-binding Zn-ribbon protein|nr:hypothetical protein [Alphaproteobacteria bacterium]MDP6517928.1 hypothetical protein [Alphaproteobacteria bacterium]